MKKVKILSLVVSAIYLMNTVVMANGIFINPGPRANSMGSAYVAVADDVTAIFWNPAGLGYLEGDGVELSTFYISADAKSNTSITNAPVGSQTNVENNEFYFGKVYATEPDSFNSKKFETNASLPFVGGYKAFDNLVLGAGFYAVGGGGGKWEDSVPGGVGNDVLNVKGEGSYGYMVGNLSLSKLVNEKLSLGFGLNLLYMMDEQSVMKEYLTEVGSPYPNYLLKLNTDATGTGFEIVGGTVYKATDKLRLGLVLKSGSTIKLTGTSKITQMFVSNETTVVDTDYEQNYRYPMTASLGTAYDPTEQWTLALAFQFNDYSVMKTDVDYEDVNLPDTDVNNDWEDTYQVRVGAEYRATDILSFRAGVETDPSPWPRDKHLDLTNTTQYDLTSICFGVGYLLGKAQIDFNYNYSISDEPELDGRTYEYPNSNFRLGVGYNF